MDKKVKYDLVVYGATGFTGRLVVDYIIREYGIINKDFTWAIAGRNKDSLTGIVSSYNASGAKLKNIPIIIADSNDPLSLDLMTSICSIIISTAGPYMKYGLPLVNSCVKNNTHYCDLTGEVPFIKNSILNYDAEAKKNKTKIVHCCGFDSLPSDIGVHLLQINSVNNYKIPCNDVTTYASTKGGLSGGTIASMINIFEHMKSNPDLKNEYKSVYCLDNTNTETISISRKNLKRIKWDKEENGWLCPFIMSGINSRIVYKTNSISDFNYGTDFMYSEVAYFKKGLSGFFNVLKLYFSLLLLRISLTFSPLLFVLNYFYFPNPGNGPDKNTMKTGFFKMRIKGTTPNKQISQVTVLGNSDPGYSATAKMITESALSILLNKDTIPESHGVLTPASALGLIVVDRLKDKGITFNVDR